MICTSSGWTPKPPFDANKKLTAKAWHTSVKQIAWNMLHEIWNICMIQQINIFQWNSAHYETWIICFLKYISRNLLIALREEMLRNFQPWCHVFRRFKWKDYNKLHEIYFLSVHRAANMFHRAIPHLKLKECGIRFSCWYLDCP